MLDYSVSAQTNPLTGLTHYYPKLKSLHRLVTMLVALLCSLTLCAESDNAHTDRATEPECTARKCRHVNNVDNKNALPRYMAMPMPSDALNADFLASPLGRLGEASYLCGAKRKTNSKTMNFVDELRWRGMVHDIMPGTEELLARERVAAYIGFDPTADSLHIGHLCSVMILRHLQRCGHQPVVLIGGATGMIGDPSGKSAERNLLTPEVIARNMEGMKQQFARFLDFDERTPNHAVMVNNYDWMKDYSFLDFAREIGKHITVNYMMAKDSVKKRLNGEARDGLSFTEFTYQLLQGYDFLHLYRTMGCRLQMGGSDQWGNITTGTELIRRTDGGEAFAMTCPLITKADGGKFGKTEAGNVWLDRRYTSPYRFYQFWLNVSDDDARRYIKIFTTLDREEIEALISEHDQAPHLRALQRRLAREVTVMVHGEADWQAAVEASGILFGNDTGEALRRLDEDTLLAVMEGVPRYEVPMERIAAGVKAVDLLTADAPVFASRGEMRKLVQGGGVSLNKERLTAFDRTIGPVDLLDGRYLLVQRGKKNYYLIMAR